MLYFILFYFILFYFSLDYFVIVHDTMLYYTTMYCVMSCSMFFFSLLLGVPGLLPVCRCAWPFAP